jgi:hypothetical protein
MIIWQSPHFASPGGEKDRSPCPQRGRKGESSDKSGQKRGSRRFAKSAASLELGVIHQARVRGTDRCYERYGADRNEAIPGGHRESSMNLVSRIRDWRFGV